MRCNVSAISSIILSTQLDSIIVLQIKKKHHLTIEIPFSISGTIQLVIVNKYSSFSIDWCQRTVICDVQRGPSSCCCFYNTQMTDWLCGNIQPRLKIKFAVISVRSEPENVHKIFWIRSQQPFPSAPLNSQRSCSVQYVEGCTVLGHENNRCCSTPCLLHATLKWIGSRAARFTVVWKYSLNTYSL